MIYAAVNKYLMDVEVSDIGKFESGLFEYISTNEPDIFVNIKKEKVISDDTEAILRKAIEAFKEKFAEDNKKAAE